MKDGEKEAKILTRNATPCNNRDDLPRFSFTLKISLKIYEDL